LLKIHPKEEANVSINRILAVIMVLSLLVVAGLTLRSAVATSAVISGDHSYDQIEHQRAVAPQPIVGDHSYDEIEHIRADRDNQQIEDHSYDAIERIRSTRGR
jgi:hypothetical protein